MASPHKTYLGDGVYADLERGDVVLTTENGISVTNRIVLEPAVINALTSWLCSIAPADSVPMGEPPPPD